MTYGLEASLLAELLLLGSVTGLLAGLLGVGGGMLLVPFLTLILEHRGVAPDLAVKMAIATSMSTILFTSLSSVRAHHGRGAVRWDLVRGLAPGILVGGLVGGAGVFAHLKGAWLAVFFAAFVSVPATRMWRRHPPTPGRALPGRVGRALVGAAIGFLSGLVGAGGGFISVPFMTRCNVDIHRAVATSAALGFPIALANTAGYLFGGRHLPAALPGAVGYLFVPALVALATTSVLTAPVGARLAHGMQVTRLERVFATLLYALAAAMLYKGLRT